ncbi:MAG: hypothetical protein SGPRY_005323 [Prymnesium sp.]
MHSYLVLLILALLALLSDHPVDAKKGRRKTKKKSDNPMDDPAFAAAAQHHHRGTLAHVEGDLEAAKKYFRLAIHAKPDFAYAYYRLGFVLQEQVEARRERRQKDSGSNAIPHDDSDKVDEPINLFRVAIDIDGQDEMAYEALGRALREAGRVDEANQTYYAAMQMNPKSAQAYWGLGKVAQMTVDEFDSDPEDPNDPSHFFEIAAKLRPDEYQLDGTRQRKIEPKTPEKEAEQEAEAKRRRDKFLEDAKAGKHNVKYAVPEDEPEFRLDDVIHTP